VQCRDSLANRKITRIQTSSEPIIMWELIICREMDLITHRFRSRIHLLVRRRPMEEQELSNPVAPTTGLKGAMSNPQRCFHFLGVPGSKNPKGDMSGELRYTDGTRFENYVVVFVRERRGVQMENGKSWKCYCYMST